MELRIFTLWGVSPRHGRLLLRSTPRSPGGHTMDLVFRAPMWVQLPFTFIDPEVSEASAFDLASLRVTGAELQPGLKMFRISGDKDGVGYVMAAGFVWNEHDREPDDETWTSA